MIDNTDRGLWGTLALLIAIAIGMADFGKDNMTELLIVIILSFIGGMCFNWVGRGK